MALVEFLPNWPTEVGEEASFFVLRVAVVRKPVINEWLRKQIVLNFSFENYSANYTGIFV